MPMLPSLSAPELSPSGLSPQQRRVSMAPSVGRLRSISIGSVSPLSGAGATTTSSRTGRLSAVEKICFRQRPMPTPHYADKMAALQARASVDASPAPFSRKASEVSPMPRKSVFGLAGRRNLHMPQTQLEKQEQKCAEIVSSMLPSRLTGMERVKTRMEEARFRPEPAIPESPHRPGSTMSHMRSTTRSWADEFEARPTSRSVGQSLSSKAPAAAALAAKKSADFEPLAMQLLRRRNYRNPHNTPSGRSVLRVVQAAAASKRGLKSLAGLRGGEDDQGAVMASGGGGSSGGDGSPSKGRNSGFMQRKKEEEAKAEAEFVHNVSALQAFRDRLVAKFSTVRSAFAHIDLDRESGLGMREWCTVLSCTNLCTLVEARLFFNIIDTNHDGSLTLSEFFVGMETICNVSSIDCLRQRLICLGYTSMFQVLSTMDGPGDDTTMTPLSFGDLAATLRRVWVIGLDEHKAIFEAVRDPDEPNGSVTLSEVFASLAAASPCLVLEELRDRLELATHGFVHRACENIIPTGAGLTKQEFVQGCKQYGVPEKDAEQAFRLIDLERLGRVSRKQFLVAMNVSASSFVVGETRRLALMSHLGIKNVIAEHYPANEKDAGSDFYETMPFSREELSQVLADGLHMTKQEAEDLVGLMVPEEGVLTLTINEFLRGLKLFAPSVSLQSLRLQLQQKHGNVHAAFKHVQHRRKPLDRQGFLEIVKSLQVDCQEGDWLFDVLDIRAAGVVTASEFLAALQNVPLGNRVSIDSWELETKAQLQVRQELASVKKGLNNMKLQVRQGLDNNASVKGAKPGSLSARSEVSRASEYTTQGGPMDEEELAAESRAQRHEWARRVKLLAAGGGRCRAANALTKAREAGKELQPEELPLADDSADLPISPTMSRSKSVPQRLTGQRRPQSSASERGGSESPSKARRAAAENGDARFFKSVMARRTFQKVTSAWTPLGSEFKHHVEGITGYFGNLQETIQSHEPVQQVLDRETKVIKEAEWFPEH
eukprot:TRINITY_DN46408_c0_g2_i1.p1 TRINITY_DN46408_c0_g2~~TRINITY_DN46408_c0_g2_i1.p1  ORF type:complete len:998 (-),score=260.79 TRINITY_DN46408_c0_g2_i1:270-3263(-)